MVWEEVELALEPWRVSGRGEVMAMAASLREIAATSGASHGDGGGGGVWGGEESQALLHDSRRAGGPGGGGGGGGIDTPTLTMCFCELLRQVTNHCSERGRLMAHIWTSLTRQLAESETVAEMGERIAQLEGELVRAAEVHGKAVYFTQVFARLKA